MEQSNKHYFQRSRCVFQWHCGICNLQNDFLQPKNIVVYIRLRKDKVLDFHIVYRILIPGSLWQLHVIWQLSSSTQWSSRNTVKHRRYNTLGKNVRKRTKNSDGRTQWACSQDRYHKFELWLLQGLHFSQTKSNHSKFQMKTVWHILTTFWDQKIASSIFQEARPASGQAGSTMFSMLFGLHAKAIWNPSQSRKILKDLGHGPTWYPCWRKP